MKRLLIIFVSILVLSLGSCDLLGLTGDTDGETDDTTYEVKLEVESPDFSSAHIAWTIGDDDGASAEVPLEPSWVKEDECGGSEHIQIVAGNEDTAVEDEITATIYINGEEEATNTGYHDSGTGDTAVSVSAETP